MLSIPESSTKEEVKKAYRKAVLTLHPDRGGSSDEFIKLQQAYDDYIKGVGKSISKKGKPIFDGSLFKFKSY